MTSAVTASANERRSVGSSVFSICRRSSSISRLSVVRISTTSPALEAAMTVSLNGGRGRPQGKSSRALRPPVWWVGRRGAVGGRREGSAAGALRLAHALQGARSAAAGHPAVDGRVRGVGGGAAAPAGAVSAAAAAFAAAAFAAAAFAAAAAPACLVVAGGLPHGGRPGSGEAGDVEQCEGPDEGDDDDECAHPAADQTQSQRT